MFDKFKDNALLLHGPTSDSMYVFVVKMEFALFKDIQNTRKIYTNGLQAHKNSSDLYFKAFKCEITNSKILVQNLLKTGNIYLHNIMVFKLAAESHHLNNSNVKGIKIN